MDSKQAEAFQQLPYHLKAASTMAGIVVSIEKDLTTEGRKEILQSLNPGFFNIVGISNPLSCYRVFDFTLLYKQGN